MNKADINNEIVLMRKTVRQSKVHIIRKLVRDIRQLKEKKLPDERINKFKEKADRLYEELAIIKKLNFDEISKYALSTQEDPHKMLADTNITLKDRALNRLAAHKIINDKVKSIKMKYNIESNIEKILEPGKKKLRKMKHIEGKEKKKQQKLDKTLADTASTERKQWLEKHNPACLETSEKVDETSGFENFSVREQENCDASKINKKQHKLINPTSNEHPDILPENSKAGSFINNTSLNEEIEEDYGSEHNQVLRDENNEKEYDETDSKLEDVVSDNAMTTVDDFFLTDAGSHYKSTFVPKIVEQVETNDGLNRQQRRAQMFGNKIKKKNLTSTKNQPYKKQHKSNIIYKSESNDLVVKPKVQIKTTNKVGESIQEHNTALHPSWEAKKKQKVQIAAFQGKKITFDD